LPKKDLEPNAKHGSNSNIISKIATINVKISNIWNLIETIAVSCVLLFIGIMLLSSKIPWYIGATIIVVSVFIIVLQVIINRRRAHATKGFSQPDSSNQLVNTKITSQTAEPLSPNMPTPFDPNEQIVAKIVGITKAGFGLRGVELLGAGKINQPENAMVITNKRVAFIHVPIPGSDTLVSGIDIGMWQQLLTGKDIQTELNNMLSKKTLDVIINSDIKNRSILLNDIQEVAFGKLTSVITFTTTSKEKISYSILNRDNTEKLKSIFAIYVKK
jgi:transcriptional regulator of met regulon